MTLWFAVGGAVGLFCIVRGIVDLRQKRLVWGALGILGGLALWTTPIQTHAVKYDILPAAGRR